MLGSISAQLVTRRCETRATDAAVALFVGVTVIIARLAPASSPNACVSAAAIQGVHTRVPWRHFTRLREFAMA